MGKPPQKQSDPGVANPDGGVFPPVEAGTQQKNGKGYQAGGSPRKRNSDYDPLIVNTIFPDAAAVFTEPPISLSSVRGTACFVIDTNALLLPYEVGTASLAKVESSFSRLIDEKRLFIPAQVAREFARNRANTMGKLHQSLSNRRNQFQPRTIRPEEKPYPLLEATAEYKRILEIEKEFGEIDKRVQTLTKEYRDMLGRALNRISAWEWDDPISKIYARLFRREIIISPPQTSEEITKAHLHRFAHEIPPGFEDQDEKPDGGIGDLLIWYTILTIGKAEGRSVIFVTGEKKTDWWHLSERQALYPRYELLDEFRRYTSGHSFHIIQLSELLSQFGATTDVIEEVRQKEAVLVLDQEEAIHSDRFAEMALHSWLKSNYTLYEITQDNSIVDFMIHDGTGFVWVSYKVLFISHSVNSQVLKYMDKLSRYRRTVNTGAARFWFVAIFASEEYAMKAVLRWKERPLLVSVDNVSVCIGYLSKEGTFIPCQIPTDSTTSS